jgi:hypothetical protein
MRERPLRDVPAWVKVSVLAGLALQLLWSSHVPAPQATAEDLPRPPSSQVLRLAALGEPIAAAKLLMLYIQAFDYRAGSRIPYRNLDYDALMGWLGRILDLDPTGQYPLWSAARLYAPIPDKVRERKMLDFIYRQYFADPNRRWPWLAQAAVLAKHELKDIPLARKYAVALQENTTDPNAPLWVKQMVPFILEDMGELEQARILIGGLIASGQVKDQRDAELLKQRLKQLETRLKERKR